MSRIASGTVGTVTCTSSTSGQLTVNFAPHISCSGFGGTSVESSDVCAEHKWYEEKLKQCREEMQGIDERVAKALETHGKAEVRLKPFQAALEPLSLASREAAQELLRATNFAASVELVTR